jgi:hypothetical protein
MKSFELDRSAWRLIMVRQPLSGCFSFRWRRHRNVIVDSKSPRLTIARAERRLNISRLKSLCAPGLAGGRLFSSLGLSVFGGVRWAAAGRTVAGNF